MAGAPGGLTIDGPGPNLLTIDAEGYSRVFSVYGNTTISGVTITGGDGIGFNYGQTFRTTFRTAAGCSISVR